MGKGDKRGKAKLPPLASLAPSKMRQPNGQASRRKATNDVTPQAVALAARCRQMGTDHTKPENRARARAQTLEGPIGVMLNIGCPDTDEIQRIWAVWHGLTSAQAAYSRRYLGINQHAQGANLQAVPEPWEVRPDQQTDTRTPDEKDRDAVNVWMRWEGHLGCLVQSDRVMISRAARGVVPDLVSGGRLTRAGGAMLAAFGRLADVVERRR